MSTHMLDAWLDKLRFREVVIGLANELVIELHGYEGQQKLLPAFRRISVLGHDLPVRYDEFVERRDGGIVVTFDAVGHWPRGLERNVSIAPESITVTFEWVGGVTVQRTIRRKE